MNVSDILLDCSKECARLARECRDARVTVALSDISLRLFLAATRDAELVQDDTQATSQPALHASLQSRQSG
jgi:hypothetical protein